MKSYLLFSCLFLAGGFVQAFDEANVLNEVYDRIKYPERHKCDNSREPVWKLEKVSTNLRYDQEYSESNRYDLRYSIFGCTLGSRGPIVMFPGRSEGSVDYLEMAYDYIGAGHSPVIIMDPRGQGFSPRMLPNLHKGHVVYFDDYVLDLKVMMDKAVLPNLKGLGWQDGDDLFLTSNSMGGSAAIGYFQLVGDENPFTAGAFMGAGILTNYASFLPFPQTPALYQQFSEANVNLLMTPRCVDPYSDTCQDYPQEITSQGISGDYDEKSRNFKPDTEAIMTHSEARYSVRTCLFNGGEACPDGEGIDWQKFKEKYYSPGELWENQRLGLGTNSWVYQSTVFNSKMRAAESIEKMASHVPIALVSGTRDLRIYRVYDENGETKMDLKHHQDFCDHVSAIKGEGHCTLIPIVGAFHETYKETDYGPNYRGQTMKAAIDFFQNASTKKK